MWFFLMLNYFKFFLKKKTTINTNKVIYTLFFKEYFKYLKTTHSYHLVDPSPWPILASLGAFMFTSGTVVYMHKFIGGWGLLMSGFFMIIFVMYTWWRDIVREATFEDTHSTTVQKGLRLGMLLFILSEVMFFFAFFWAFLHSSIAPTYNIGGVWPPQAISVINTYTVPLTNTFFLLTSGATVTWAHHALLSRAKKHTIIALLFTLILAVLFTCLQGFEYVNAPFNISDGIYGSCFYLATGFHGFHVFVGTIALFISFIRIVLNHFTNKHHFGFESAIWYWHFVDVVWLFLFITVYYWSNTGIGSSTISPLTSKGKLSAISWVLTQISNSEFLIMGLYLLMDFFLVCASLAIFFILYCSNNKIKHEIKEISKFFFNLPIINKMFLFSFTTSFAIPNKILINNGINSYLIFFIVTCLFFMADELPFVTLALISYFLLALESVLFAYLYENDVYKFQKFVNAYLFVSNQEFAKKYFNFFWGNMDKAGKMVMKTGAGGFIARTIWNAITENEDNNAQMEAERRVAKASQTATTETSTLEALAATKDQKEKIMEEKATFTKAEKKVEAFVKDQIGKMADRSSGSGSDK